MPWCGRLWQYECYCDYRTPKFYNMKTFANPFYEEWMHNALLKHKEKHHTEEVEREIARLKAELEFPREAMLLICLADNETNQTPIATLTDDVLQCVFQHLC